MNKQKNSINKYIIFILIIISVGIINYSTAKMLNGLREDYYKENLAVSTNPPKITEVNTTNSDIVNLKIVKGDVDFDSIIVQNIGTNETLTQKVVNQSTTQYLSLKNGNYKIIIRDKSNNYTMFSKYITVAQSCTNDPLKNNVVGVATSERCYKTNGNGNYEPDIDDTLAYCKEGYVADESKTKAIINECQNITTSNVTQYGLTQRYCKVKFQFECVPENKETQSQLKTLNLSAGSLSPSFSPSKYEYKATVYNNNITIGATLADDGSKFVSGYGPRNVNLKIGTNKVLVKVQSSSGHITTYTITITKPDERSADNSLSSLSLTNVKINENFQSSITEYTANVGEEVESVFVNAKVKDVASSFVTGYGPREIKLQPGKNNVVIKVESERGTIKVYTIAVYKPIKENKPIEAPYLKNIIINKNEELESSFEIKLDRDFDPSIEEYKVIVPNEITVLFLEFEKNDASHKLDIKGNENFVEDKNNIVEIIVTDPETKLTRTYTLNVFRNAKGVEPSTDSYLKNIVIKGHEIKFKKTTTDYEITLKDGEKELDITAELNSDTASLEIIGNEKLKDNSEIIIKVTAEDGTTQTEYTIKTIQSEGGSSIGIIIVIIIIVLAIAYLILRMLGYRIYFNLDMITSKFKKKNK